MSASGASENLRRQKLRQRELEEEEATRRILGAAAQLTEKAETGGVLAYLLKPLTRERPNERFLQNTLRSVDYANRRADEAEMWEHLDLARERERRERRERSQRMQERHGHRSPAAQTSARRSHKRRRPSDEAEEEEEATAGPGGGAGPSMLSDTELDRFLASKRSRGRGGVGSRTEEAGPYLPGPGAGHNTVDAEETTVPTRKPQQGPSAPAWILQARQDASSSSNSSEVSSLGSPGQEDAASHGPNGKDKKRRKGEKDKKEKHKKRKKQKLKDKDKKQKKTSKKRREKRSTS